MTESGHGNERLACFELWGGNAEAVHPVELPGLAGWISTTPFERGRGGGDVHYLSVCSKGQVSRIVVADVAGHGPSADAVARRLREVLQQHTDHWDQSALVRELNDAFGAGATTADFATAFVLGFYVGTGELLFTNAGHPPALWYHAQEHQWDWLADCTPHAKTLAGLPLGVIPGTSYAQTAVEIREGDLLMLYTDGITESRNQHREELELAGLLALAEDLSQESFETPAAAGQALLRRVQDFRGGGRARDDETLVVLRRQGSQ